MFSFEGWEAGCLILFIVFGLPVVLAWESVRKEEQFKRRYWASECRRVRGEDE